MTLATQNIFIDFGKGLDNSLDPKLVIPSKFTRLDNLEFNAGNTVRQRPGYTRQTITAHTNSPDVTNVRRLMALGEEVLLEADSGLHAFLQEHTVSRDECGGGFIGSRIKTFERAQIDYNDVAASQQDQYGIDVCIATQSRLECWVWTETSRATAKEAVFYKVIDSVTRAVVQEGTVFFDNAGVAKAFNPRVVERYVAGGTSRFYIYYVRTDNATGLTYTLSQKHIDIADGAKVPGALSAGSDALSGVTLSSTGVFDCVFDLPSDNIAFIFNDVVNDVYLWTNQASDGVTAVDNVALLHTDARSVSISVVDDGAGNSYSVGVYQTNTNAIYSGSAPIDNLGSGGLVDATIATPTAPGRVTSMVSPFLSDRVLVFYDFNPYSAGEVFAHDIGFVSVVGTTAAAVVGTESTFARSVVLAARPIVYYSSAGLADVCVPVALLSDLQPTVFALKFGGAAKANSPGFDNPNSYTSPRVLARVFPGECGSLKAKYANNLRVPTCLAGFSTSVKIPFTKKGKPQFEAGVDVTPSRATLGTLYFSLSLPSFEAQRSLFMTGACPMEYDGAVVHEAGFNYFPEGVTGTAGGGGSLEVSATYGAVLVYEWENAKGVLCRSTPSVPVSVTTGGAQTSITWKFPYLRLTDKMGVDDGAAEQRNNVRIVLYRTVKNGTLYYREAAPSSGFGFRNRTSLTTVGSWVSIQSDASLISGELLYTTGGALDNEAFPSTSIACLHQNRIFTVMQEEQSWIQYTDEIDERFLAPATSEVYRLRVPPEAGKVVGLASIDEKLIVVCEKQVGYYFGEGPNRLGQQNGYSQFQIASTTLGGLLGCQESVVVTPDGVFFMSSANGLRMLTRGMSIAMQPGNQDTFFGAEVDSDFDVNYSGIKGLSVKSKSQIRWFLAGTSTVIIYNFEQHQWSKSTNVNSDGGAVVARSLFYHSDRTLLQADDAAVGGLDDIAVTPRVLESAWINLADKQGYQRAYKLMLLGQALGGSDALLTLEEGFDYEPGYVSSVSAGAAASRRLVKVSYTGAGGAATTPVAVTGGTSGAVGTVLIGGTHASSYLPGVTAPNNGTLYLRPVSGGLFTPGETVSGVGFSATVSASAAAIQFTGVTTSPVQFLDLLTAVAWTGTVVNQTTIGAFFICTIFTFTTGAFANMSDERLSIARPFNFGISDADPLQIEHPISRQKCEAIRFRLTITPNAGEVRLTNFGVKIGVKKGMFKIPSAQRY